MGLNRILHTKFGQTLLSIILGFGLASLFRKVCHDDKCLQFNGPILDEVEGKTFKSGNKCYQYEAVHSKCDSTKKTIDIHSKKL